MITLNCLSGSLGQGAALNISAACPGIFGILECVLITGQGGAVTRRSLNSIRRESEGRGSANVVSSPREIVKALVEKKVFAWRPVGLRLIYFACLEAGDVEVESDFLMGHVAYVQLETVRVFAGGEEKDKLPAGRKTYSGPPVGAVKHRERKGLCDGKRFLGRLVAANTGDWHSRVYLDRRDFCVSAQGQLYCRYERGHLKHIAVLGGIAAIEGQCVNVLSETMIEGHRRNHHVHVARQSVVHRRFLPVKNGIVRCGRVCLDVRFAVFREQDRIIHTAYAHPESRPVESRDSCGLAHRVIAFCQVETHFSVHYRYRISGTDGFFCLVVDVFFVVFPVIRRFPFAGSEEQPQDKKRM